MNKKLLVTAIFAIAATAVFADVTPAAANTVSQNIGANNNTAATANTINAAVAAANPAPSALTGNVSVMGGFKPDQGRSPQYDNPNAVNVNYKSGNWTWSLNGATEFTGLVNSSMANNSVGAGGTNQNTMLNTWGITSAYNFQNGLTASMNISYLNWRSQSNGNYLIPPTATSSGYNGSISPVLVTGYQLAPNLTYINGNNTFGLAVTYQVVGSSNGLNTVANSAGYRNGTWNGQNGEYFSVFPMYTNQITPNFSFGTGVQIQQANDNFIILSTAANNESNNDIIYHPAILSYNIAAVPGLNLNLDTRYYYFNLVQNDAVQASQGIPGSTRLCFYPGIAYTMKITPALTWTTNAQVYAKYYTNNVNGQITQGHGGNGSTNYGGQIYTGFNYTF